MYFLFIDRVIIDPHLYVPPIINMKDPAIAHSYKYAIRKLRAEIDVDGIGTVTLYSRDCIEGVGKNTILTLLSETGIKLTDFPTARHFSSWLRLSPNNKISGGKVLSHRTNKGRSRLAGALRHAANVIGNSVKQGSLHQFFKRVAFKKGQLTAITATARKLATIIWNMLTNKQQYKATDQIIYLTKIRASQVKNLQRKINQLKILPQELMFTTS